MKWRWTFRSVIIVILLSSMALISQLHTGTAQAALGRREEVVLIHFKPTTSLAERDAIIAQVGGELLSWLEPLHVAQVRLQQNGDGVRQAAAQLAFTAAVELVEADAQVMGAVIPDDPAATDPYKVYAPQLLNLFAAWGYTTGSSEVTIAVLDTGLAHAHPEFAGRVLPGYDVVHQDTNPEDGHGHGTHVAGIATAAIDNATGSAGVCGACSILPVQVLDERNQGTWHGVATGLIWATDQGADIAILSLGSVVNGQVMAEAVAYAVAHDVFVVAAAGNFTASVPFYPAAYPGVFGVAATTRLDQKWNYSNFGDFVDGAAPGDAIYSTHADIIHEGGYMMMSGTSSAAPFVAGLAGLLLAQAPERTAADLERLITTTAVDLGEPGRDPMFGYGRIDPVAALHAEAADHPLTANLNGAIWDDSNQNNVQEAEEQTGFASVELTLSDTQGRFVGLAASSVSGAWQMTVADPLTATLRIIFPAGHVTTGESERSMVITPSVNMVDLNFGLAPAPTPNDVRDLKAIRFAEEIELTWTLTNQVVRTVIIERATIEDGEYMAVGELPADQAQTAESGERTGDFVDRLPAELSNVTVYYRIKLAPGNVTSESVSAEPVAAAPVPATFTQYLPVVSR